MAKIGIITDKCSNYNNMYPHLREAQVWMRALIKDSHDVHLLFPTFSDAMWKKFHGGMKDRFQEWFQDGVGIKPTYWEKKEENLDVLIVVGIPWIHAFNYEVIDYIKEYSEKVTEIIWMVFDYEMYANQKSLLYNIISKDNPEVFKKIKCVITTDPTLKSTINKPHYHMPHLYDPFWEIPIKPKSERKLLSRFVGPIGFRKAIADILPILDKLGEEVELRSEFWGENFAKKYRDVQFTFEGKSYKTIDVKGERVFLPYNDYLKFCSNSIITLHDSYPPGWLKNKYDIALWFSGKINDAYYSGVLPFSSPYLGEQTHWGNITDLTRFYKINTMNNDGFKYQVEYYRNEHNKVYGIDTWYPKIKEWFGI